MAGESVIWHHRTGTGRRDRYNKPILEDVDDELTEVLVAPNLGDEVTGSADDTSSARITLYLADRDGVRAGILASDEVTVRGVRYKVISDEADWSTGFSDWNPGTVVQLARSEHTDA
jgi:hypothetical protein